MSIDAAVLKHKWPEHIWSVVGDDIICESDKSFAPTKKQLKEAVSEYEEYKESISYKDRRKEEYPDIGDQLDVIMKWIATETEFKVPDELKSIAMTCMSVKSKYPKPE